MADDLKPWQLCERPPPRSVKRLLEFLREYCPNRADRLIFGSKITLWDKPFATVQWDECDEPTFLFDDRVEGVVEVRVAQQEKKREILRRQREDIYWRLFESCPTAIDVLERSPPVWTKRSTKLDLSTEVRCLLAAKLLEPEETFVDFEGDGPAIFRFTFSISPHGWGFLHWLDDVAYIKKARG